MDDLISRKEAVNALRTAKVKKIEMSQNPKNIVWKCENCGQYMHKVSWAREVNYCSHCGSKIEWDRT